MDLRIKLYRGQGGLIARVRMLDAHGVVWRTYLLPDDGETVTLSRAQEQAAQHASQSLQKIHRGRVPAHARQLMMEVEMPKKPQLHCRDCIAFLPTKDAAEGICWETREKMLGNAVACRKVKPWTDYSIEFIPAPR